MQTLEEEVNNPKHYNSHESGIEAIEITRNLPSDLANVWKYAMRYEDKGTPKKDLLKAIFYFNDFREHFIDENNAATVSLAVPSETFVNMTLVYMAEPNETIRNLFSEIIKLVGTDGIISPKTFEKTLNDVKTMAESFSN